LAYSLGEQQFRAAENKQKAERARLSTLAKQLNEHPVFHTARAPEKLKYLARKLFPDADDAEIRIIVDEAIKENWLQESGYYAAGSD
jgi:transcriptional regulator